MPIRPRFFTLLLSASAVASLALTACTSLTGIAVSTIYDRVPWPDELIESDLDYRPNSSGGDDKQELNFFRPDIDHGWPTVIFVHGGSWTAGDRNLLVGEEHDIYNNIGRYLASEGIGAAVISYHLQPSVDWHAQARDVAHAFAFVRDHVVELGGDPEAIFFAGHSAGSQLAAYVSLADWPLGDVDFTPDDVCGVVAVSGVGYDLMDDATYDVHGASRELFETRLRPHDAQDDWRRKSSAVTYVTADAPSFLIMYSDDEWPSLQYQNSLFYQALAGAGASVDRVIFPGQGHRRLALSMSQPSEDVAQHMVEFVKATGCG